MNLLTLLTLHPDIANAQEFERLIATQGADFGDVEVELEEFEQTVEEVGLILPSQYRSVEEMQERLIWTPSQ